MVVNVKENSLDLAVDTIYYKLYLKIWEVNVDFHLKLFEV